MDDNYVLKEGSPTSPMLDEHSTATIIEKTVDVSDIGEFIIGESNSSIITFRMNRYYDGVDLLEKTIKVMYRNSNGIFESDVVNIKYTSNSLKFSWIVPHDATTSKKLLAYVCFVSDGYLWKTKTFTITVDQSFDVGDSEPTQNWFVNIESKLTKIEKTIDEIAEWARQPEKPTYTYEEVGAEKAGTSEKNLEKSKSYTDEEVRKVKEEVLPEKIKDVESFVSTQIQDENKMYFIKNRYEITYDEITSIVNDDKIPYFYDDGNVYIYNGRKDEAYEFYSVTGDKLRKYTLSSDNTWNNDDFSIFKSMENKDNLNRMDVGYCFLHSDDDLSNFDFPEKADKTKDSLLVCYDEGYNTSRRQVLYNESNLFTRDGFIEMENVMWSNWTEIGASSSTSSSIMYIHVTSEEKDGETVWKSDKTYEEIKEAVDSGKSPVAIYQDRLFFTLGVRIPGNSYIFTNSILGAISIGIDYANNNTTIAECCNVPPYVSIIWSVNNTGINVQIINDDLTNLPTDIDAYLQNCYKFGKIPAIGLRVKKNTNGVDLRYNVLLYYTGKDFAGTTFINDNLTYCRLTMEDMSDTSTWDYTATEIPVNTTDEHINTLIDTKLGVIENGTY